MPAGGSPNVVEPQLAEELHQVATESGERMLRWFTYSHLPQRLQVASAIYARAAVRTVQLFDAGPERTVALRKLLEAKAVSIRLDIWLAIECELCPRLVTACA